MFETEIGPNRTDSKLSQLVTPQLVCCTSWCFIASKEKGQTFKHFKFLFIYIVLHPVYLQTQIYGTQMLYQQPQVVGQGMIGLLCQFLKSITNAQAEIAYTCSQ